MSDDEKAYQKYLYNLKHGLIPPWTQAERIEMRRRQKANAKIAAKITDEDVRLLLERAEKAREEYRAKHGAEGLNDD